MERRTIVGIIVIAALLGLGYYGYTRYVAQEPQVPPSETMEEEIPRVVSATGVVMPARWANLSFQTGGRVEEIAVEVGDEVREGQLLAHLDATALERQVAQAEARLAAARAQLARVRAGARPEEIEAARQAVAAARAGLAAAEAQLAQAQAGLDEARAAQAKLLVGATSYQRELARLAVDQARDLLWGAQAERDGVKGNKANPDYLKDAAEANVLSAEVAVRMAEVEAAQLEAGPTQEEKAMAQAQVDLAQAQVDAARAQVEGARAQVAQAEAQLAALEAGPTPEEIALAEAQVREAEAILAQAQAALQDASLFAPFDGTVGEVLAREGEIVGMSLGMSEGGLTAPVLVLGDLSRLRVETTDLNEVDIAKVHVGQRVEITFDALPERKLTGRVARIAPKASLEQGGTNYTVIIELDEQDPDLRWGMTAFVDIVVE